MLMLAHGWLALVIGLVVIGGAALHLWREGEGRLSLVLVLAYAWGLLLAFAFHDYQHSHPREESVLETPLRP
jgi:hypothetical protein